MDQGAQRQPLERVRRRTGHCLSPGDVLSRTLTPDQVRTWAQYGETSPLHVHLSEVIARDDELMPVLNRVAFEILSRTGLDLNPVNASVPEDRDWLLALIWPEHDRRERLRAALTMAAKADIELVGGDALTQLAPTLGRLPPGYPVVVMHSFVLNQFHPTMREQVDRILEESRGLRAVHRISMEALDTEETSAALSLDSG